MSCGNGTRTSPFFGCCPTVEPHLIGNTWTAHLTVNAWVTPLSYSSAQQGLSICPTGFYKTLTGEFYSYDDFDINRPRLMGTSTASYDPPNGAYLSASQQQGATVAGVAEITAIISESETMFHMGQYQNDPSLPGSIVSSTKVTLSDPFDPMEYWPALMGSLAEHFNKWEEEDLRRANWTAYHNRLNQVVSGTPLDIPNTGFGQVNYPYYQSPNPEHVCAMDAYCYQVKSLVCTGGTSGRNGRFYRGNPFGFFNRAWRRVVWDFFRAPGTRLFEWQRDNITKWDTDGCTEVRATHCPGRIATRCIEFGEDRTGEGNRVVHTPPDVANSYGRTIRGNCL